MKSIEVKMAAGEAHWQNGVVERHIGTFRTPFNKLLMDDTYEGATNQSIVDATCEAKNSMVPTMVRLQFNGLLDAPGIHWWVPPKHHHHLPLAQNLNNTC